LELPNEIPSHDTIQRVIAMVSPEYLQEFRRRWNEIMSGDMREKIEKILFLEDGKTQRGNGNDGQKANHIVSAVDSGGFCVGEVKVDEKSNEITAIPELLKQLNVKDTIVTTDAMGYQTGIARLIRQKKAKRYGHKHAEACGCGRIARISMKNKRYLISMSFRRYLDTLMAL